jgi:hypothetical protein
MKHFLFPVSLCYCLDLAWVILIPAAMPKTQNFTGI